MEGKMKNLCAAMAVCAVIGLIVPPGVNAAQTSPEGICQSYLLYGELSQPAGANPALALMQQD
jgi:hypothetical protein